MITSNEDFSIGQNPDRESFSHSYSGFTLKTAYHTSTIEQNKKIINVSVKITYIGIIIIFIGIVASFFGKTSTAVITCSSGVIVEIISNIAFWIVGKEMEEKLKYFSSLALDEEGEKYIALIEKMSNGKAKEKMIEKLVENYCSRRIGNNVKKQD